MLFNTTEYGVFLVVVLAIFWAMHRWTGARVGFLCLASYVFYGAWNPWYLPLIVAITAVHYAAGRLLERPWNPARKRWVVGIAAAASLGLLAYFKYLGFFEATLAGVLQLAGWEGAVAFPRPELPVGISFYVFQCIAYTVDVHRGRVPACRSVLDFALFVSFFAQLVAGPIMRANDLLPQLRKPPAVSDREALAALALIIAGLFKKLAIADLLGSQIVNPFHDNLEALWGAHAWLAFYAFPFQIYCDFSGYCDIAIGSAALFGIRLVDNFDAPYLAQGIREFWQRWHMTLSSWLRDYLYIPLGGNRKGRGRTAVNLLLTMGLGGLWHGASWTFVIWGLYHGVLLVAERFLSGVFPSLARPSRGWAAVLRRVVTFHILCFGLILFRSPTLGHAGRFLRSLFGPFGPWATPPLPRMLCSPTQLVIVVLAAVFLHHVKDETALRIRERFARLPTPLVVIAVFVALQMMAWSSYFQAPFIYFQF